MTIVAEQRKDTPAELGTFDDLVATWSELDLPEGYRAEVAQGAIRVNPAPVPPHALIASIVHDALSSSAPRGMRVFEGLAVRFDASEAVYIPDVLVAPVGAIKSAMDDDNRFWVYASDLLITVEITSRSNARVDRKEKRDAYALGGVPAYLLVDRVRRHPSVTLSTDPADGEYRHVVTVPFGEPIRLPPPFDADLDTEAFPR